MNIAATHQCLFGEKMIVMHACCFVVCANTAERDAARESEKCVESYA